MPKSSKKIKIKSLRRADEKQLNTFVEPSTENIEELQQISTPKKSRLNFNLSFRKPSATEISNNSDQEIQSSSFEKNIPKSKIRKLHLSILDRIKKESKESTVISGELTKPNIKIIQRKKLSKKKKILLGAVMIFLILLGISSYFAYIKLYIPATRIKEAGYRIKDNSKAIATDFDKKDISQLDARVSNIRQDMELIDGELQQFEFLQKLKWTKGYYDNLQVTRNVITKTDTILQETLPEFKELLQATGFKTDSAVKAETSTTVTEPANAEAKSDEDSAFSLILKDMPEYLALYKKTEPSIQDLLNEIAKLNPDYIPEINGYDIDSKLEKVKDFSKEYPETSKQMVSFLDYMPQLLGSESEKTYLLILQNEAEMRSSGGLITAYGTLKMNKGEVGEITLTDSWNVEIYVSYTLGIDTGNRNIYGQDVLMNSNCGSSYLRAQDSGIYPDLNWTMNKFREYYDIANTYNPEEFPSYDYVMMINYAFSEQLLNLIQPLEVEGFGTVTADTLFDFIKAETDSKELAGSKDRKEIIEAIANAVKEKLFDMDAAKGKDLLQFIVNGFLARNMAIAAPFDNQMQAYLDKYSMSGRFANEFSGDYFHLNEAQNCALKLNKYVRDRVVQNIDISADGTIHKYINVRWENPQVFNNAIGNNYSATISHSYRAWVRLMVPPEVSDFNSDGFIKSGYLYYNPQTYYDDVMNKSVSDNIIQFDHRRFSDEDPIPSHELNVDYELPAYLNYKANGVYRMLIQKHPGKSWGEPYIVEFNDNGQRHKVEFVLDKDKVLTYSNGVITVDNYDKNLDWLLNLLEDVPFEKLKK